MNAIFFLNSLNSLHPSLRFTFKKESNLALPFLDPLLEKSPSKFITSIYRKPTLTNQYLSYILAYRSQLFSYIFFKKYRCDLSARRKCKSLPSRNKIESFQLLQYIQKTVSCAHTHMRPLSVR